MLELYPRDVRLALLFVALAALSTTGHAAAQTTGEPYEIIVMPGFELSDLEGIEESEAAVGLLVPANGPETSGAQARAALARGAVESSHLGGLPKGPAQVEFREGSSGGWTSYAPLAEPGKLTIVLGLPTGGTQANERRYPIAVWGEGFAGLLTSDSARIPGLVSVADVAPTALGDEDGLGSRPAEDPIAELAALDERIEDHVSARLLGAAVAGLAALLWAFLLPRGGIVAFAVALSLNLVAGATGLGGWGAIALLGLGTLALTPLIVRGARSELALGFLCVAVLAGYLVSMAIEASVVALSPWGPAQAGRFYGVTNLPETMLLVPALAGAAFLGRRFGPVGFGAVALLALVTISGARFGADGGGAIVLGVGFAVLAVLLVERGLRWLIPALLAAAAVVVVFTLVDRATGGSSHVTSAAGEGAGNVLGDIGRRVRISWDHATSEWYTGLLVSVCVAALAALVVFVWHRAVPLAEKALPLSFAAAVVTSLVVNDSPTHVATAGLVGFVVLGMGTLALDATPPPSRRAPGRARVWAPGGGLRRRRDSRAPA